MNQISQTGLDLLLQQLGPSLKSKRLAVLCHQASINSRFEHITDVLKNHQLIRLFGPEHGLWGNAQDMISVDNTIDPRTKKPVISLYGHTFDSLKPKAEDLADLDTLIIDLQDIGSRYYTFIYTMAFAMQACAALGKAVIVIDRPNPIDGLTLEGPLLQTGFESFVGIYPLPIRHGMTIGELALYFNTEYKINCDLTVVKMNNWQRSWHYTDTNLPWVHPSPNMPTLNTALLYPGMCLIEATELSEGRGTTKPFELIGAPYINPWHLADKLNQLALPGIVFRPTVFTPGFQKHAGKDCSGVFIHITDPLQLKPVELGVHLIKTIKDLYPADFKWREKPYEFVTDKPAVDLLWGSPSLRLTIESGQDLSTLIESCQNDWKPFAQKREKYLLY